MTRTVVFRTLALALLGAVSGWAQRLVDPPLIIFIGPPGSGKSTQATKVSQKIGAPMLSPETMLRAHKALFDSQRNPKLSGMEPDSDPAMNRLFAASIQQGGLTKGLILDGYPATKDHADYLAKQFQAGLIPAPVIIQLDAPDEVVRKRLKDQAGPSLDQRIKDYHREMEFVQLYFPNAEIHKIDSTRPANKVGKDVWKVVSTKLKKQ